MVFKAVILVAMLCAVNGKVLLYDSDTGLAHAVKEVLAPVGANAGLADAVPAVDVPADDVPADAGPADVVSTVDVAADPAHNSAKGAHRVILGTPSTRDCSIWGCYNSCRLAGFSNGFCIYGGCICRN